MSKILTFVSLISATIALSCAISAKKYRDQTAKIYTRNLELFVEKNIPPPQTPVEDSKFDDFYHVYQSYNADL